MADFSSQNANVLKRPASHIAIIMSSSLASSRFLQREPEGGPHADRAPHVDRLLVGFDDMFYYCQAQAFAFG